MATSQAADKLATELTAQIDAAKTASQELAELKQVSAVVDTDQGPADEMVETAGAEGQGKKKKRNKKKKATATTEPTDAAESEGADAAGVEEDTTSPADETPLGAAAPVQAEPVAAAEGGKEVAVPPAKEPTPEQAPGSAPATKAALPPSPAPAAAAPPAVPAPAPPAAEPKPVKVAPAIKLAAPVMAAVVQGTDKTATPASADGKSELVSKMALLSKSVVGDSVKAWGGAGAGSAGIPAASVTVPPGTRTFPYEELKTMRIDSGIDMTCKESYLTAEEFMTVFKKDIAAWKALPAWRRQLQKKDVGLW